MGFVRWLKIGFRRGYGGPMGIEGMSVGNRNRSPRLWIGFLLMEISSYMN